MKQFIIRSLVFTFIFFGGGIIAFFVIKSRSATNPGSDGAPNDLYVTNNETLKASKRNALVDKSMSCPAGFVLITNQNNVVGCIQKDPSTAVLFPAAVKDCFDRFGGRLPSYGEFLIAAKSNLVTASPSYDMVDDLWFNINNSTWRIMLYQRSTGGVQACPITTAYTYHCFIPK